MTTPHRWRRTFFPWLAALIFLAVQFGPARSQPAYSPKEARIGVLAFRGVDQALTQWTPLAEYLSANVDGWNFSIVPVTLVSAPEKIQIKQIDFLITNPGHYVTLAQQFELGVLATRERRVGDIGLLRYGTAIFTRSGSGIQSLNDLKGKSLAAVSPEAFGGFQLAWHEFHRQQIDPFTDLKAIRFMGFPQDAIVMAVLNGDVAAGVVRSGLLESLAAENRITMDKFTVLQGNDQPEYPYKVSGPLYPEWPFTALPGIDKALRENVALALLKTRGHTSGGGNAIGDLWSAPLSYESVHDLIEAYRDRGVSPPGNRFINSTTIAILALTAAIVAGLFLRQKNAPSPEAAGVTQETTANPEDLKRFQNLTRREREVLALICSGKSSRDIAEDLGISLKTVEYHRANLLQKTAAKSSAHLVQLSTRLEDDLGLSLGSFANKPG